MIPMTAASPITADCSHCWSTAGDDHARPMRTWAAPNQPPTTSRSCLISLFAAEIACKRSARRIAHGLHDRPLRHRHQPNPHRAC